MTRQGRARGGSAAKPCNDAVLEPPLARSRLRLNRAVPLTQGDKTPALTHLMLATELARLPQKGGGIAFLRCREGRFPRMAGEALCGSQTGATGDLRSQKTLPCCPPDSRGQDAYCR